MDPLGTWVGVGFAFNAGTGTTFGTVIVTRSPDLSNVTRIAGATRFATAAALSATMFASGVAVAYIAYAYNYPDALAGAAASGALAGPVLLASASGPLDPATAAELVRLRPQRIIVLGGTGAISDSVAWQLAGYATGP
jgi:putative cell wall-binding protein